MSLQSKTLDELYQYESKLEEMIRLARVYQGILEIDGVRMSAEDLRDELNSVKAEIASKVSSGKLNLVSKSGKE